LSELTNACLIRAEDLALCCWAEAESTVGDGDKGENAAAEADEATGEDEAADVTAAAAALVTAVVRSMLLRRDEFLDLLPRRCKAGSSVAPPPAPAATTAAGNMCALLCMIGLLIFASR
jgi:hypothetical protein